jgi:hypothetical protein
VKNWNCKRSNDERAEQNIRPQLDSVAEGKEKQPSGTKESPGSVAASEESRAGLE